MVPKSRLAICAFALVLSACTVEPGAPLAELGGGDTQVEDADSGTESPSRAGDEEVEADDVEGDSDGGSVHEESGEEEDSDDPTTEGDETVDPCGAVLCDPGRNDCPEGQKCSSWRCGQGCCTNSTGCFDIIGEHGVGDECTAVPGQQVDDCGPTLLCMPDHAGVGYRGHCMQLCAAEPGGHGNCDDIDDPGTHCFAFNGGSMPVCMPTCDPLGDDCESDFGDEGCYFAVDNFFCTTPTGPKGGHEDPGQEGDECWTEQGCLPGLTCTHREQGRLENCGYDDIETAICSCTRLCDTESSGATQCGGDWPRCESMFEAGEAVDELLNVGMCSK